MRVLICDFCGMRQIIPGDVNTSEVTTKLGDIPNSWDVLRVAKTVKDDGVVDLCSLCREAYNKRYILAEDTMSNTLNNWIKGHLIDVKTMMENEANRYKDEEAEND